MVPAEAVGGGMFTTEPGPDRSRLAFKEVVLFSFEFLRSYGLKPVEEEVTFVRYESETVFVNVYHGRASFELGVEVGRLSEPSEKFSIYDIVAWAGTEQAEGFGQHTMFQVSSREGVQKFVPRLAGLFKKYAVELLRGEPDAYDSVGKVRAHRAREFEKEMRLKGIRTEAEAAWHAKDYTRVVELYDSVREDLTKVEAKKLAYAEKQVLSLESAELP